MFCERHCLPHGCLVQTLAVLLSEENSCRSWKYITNQNTRLHAGLAWLRRLRILFIRLFSDIMLETSQVDRYEIWLMEFQYRINEEFPERAYIRNNRRLKERRRKTRMAFSFI